MADLLLSALVPIVVQKSGDILVQRIGEMWGIADQREKLHDKLLAVQTVLTDAVEKGDDNLAVKSWLAKLKSAAYVADDVLDEFCYEELRRDAMRRGHKAGNLSRKLKEVVGRIDELVTEMERFKFVQGRQGRVVDHVRTDSYVIESEVIGRRDDKENLVKLLTEVRPTKNLMVLPVVGMGGLGKTTLAQLVYNDPKVKEYFNLQIWICVSQDFNIGRLVKLIIELVKGECNISIENMELLQRRLREILSGKRYVLVLDDVWNENVNEWEHLRALLDCGDLGSVVIVTTRNDRAAQIMGTIESYNLECLGEKDSWSLFQKRAFREGVNKHPELVEIGRKLVQKCRGLPLAIKALGSLLSYKHEVHKWSAVLKQSTIWEHKHANDEVLPALRLSYDHLPSYMKQCFAFCAVFPKDYVIGKERLVQYWMAHGFIPSDVSGDLEMMGSDIFNELVWRSFFQDVEQVFRDSSEYRSQTTCKMHDLMHDLAQSVMRDECLCLLEPFQINNNLECNMRHIFLTKFSKGTEDINDVITCYPAARTVISKRLTFVKKIGLVKSNFLRVFDFPQCGGNIMIIPGKMKHLRYLQLEHVVVTAIPEAITTLYLLQTLRLSSCPFLSELPEGMRYMMSLRHLYIHGCSELKCMPPSLGELKYLQTLTYYVAGTGVGNKIGELKNLNLGGKLEVYNLKEVGSAREAREVIMESKQNLDYLVLSWGMPDDYSVGVRCNSSEAVVGDLEVLDALKPYNKLKVLRIKEYRGDKFPIWMYEYQMLENIVELCISKCRRCVNLPPLHRLPLLQSLNINYMDKLKHLFCGVFMNAEGGDDAPNTFSSLKSLYLYDMPNLDCWCEGDVGEETSLIFPVLSHLRITNCPKLSAIPATPKLEKMIVVGNNTLSCLATGITNVRSLTLESRGGRENNAEETLSFKTWVSLKELNIKGFNHIIPPKDKREGEMLNVDVSATALRNLRIDSSNFWFSSIPSNSPLWLWKCFTYLEFLYIQNCDGLTSWPEEELSNLNCLRIMKVSSCKNFLGSKSKPPPTMSSRQMLLPKLESLIIENCPNMVEVPKLPISLEKLEIMGSTKLESLPEQLGSLVALKNLQIDNCESLNSLPSSIGGHTTLTMLIISNCMNLSSLPEGMQELEALKFLIIRNCPKIRILPEGLLQRLRSLDKLEIEYCPLLKRDFRKHGKYGHLISEIPDIKIGERDRSSKRGDLTHLISSCKISCFSGQS